MSETAITTDGRKTRGLTANSAFVSGVVIFDLMYTPFYSGSLNGGFGITEIDMNKFSERAIYILKSNWVLGRMVTSIEPYCSGVDFGPGFSFEAMLSSGSIEDLICSWIRDIQKEYQLFNLSISYMLQLVNEEPIYGGEFNFGMGMGGTGGKEEGSEPPNQVEKDEYVNINNCDFFMPYNATGDCLASAKLILDNYGLKNQYGSSGTAIKTVFEKNSQLQCFDEAKATYDKTIECIKRHIDANRPIIAGVNHSIGLNYNDGITDHFIVITGYGINKGIFYLIYMDPGRNITSEGCNDRENRLYYIETEGRDNCQFLIQGSSCIPKFESYELTQVRPNF